MGFGGSSNIDMGMGISFSADDLASGPINLLYGNFQRLKDSVGSGSPRIAAGFGMIAAGATGIAAGITGLRQAWSFAETAGEFDYEMAGVRNIAGATAEEFDAMGRAAIQAGIDTQYTPVEAAQGLETLASQGLNARDSIRALVPMLDFAAAGNIDVAEAAEVAMSVLNSYGMSVDQITSVSDRLMRGTQLTALSTDEFITVIGRAASSGRIFGTGIDDVIIALGSMRNAGIPAEVATTSLGEAMRRLTTDESAGRALRRLGIEIADSEGNLRSIIDITHDFSLATQDLTEVEQARIANEVFGVRGLQEFNAIANITARTLRNGVDVTLTGAEAIAYYRNELNNAGGASEAFRRDRMATFMGQMEQLAGSIETVRIVLGQTFGPIFTPLITAFANVLNMLSTAWQNLPVRVRNVIGVLTLAGSVISIIVGGILVLAGGITLLVGAFSGLAATLGTVLLYIGAALLPLIAIVGGFIAAGFALYRAWEENLGGMRDWTTSTLNTITLAWQAFQQIFTQGYLSGAIRGEMLANHGELLNFVQGVYDFWQQLRRIWGGFVSAFREAWQGMAPTFQALQQAFDNLFSQIGRTFAGPGSLIDQANNLPGEEFASFGERLGATVGLALEYLLRGVIAIVDAISWMMDVWLQIEPIVGPILYVWAQSLQLVWSILGPLVEMVLALLQGLEALSNVVNPMTWIGRLFGQRWGSNIFGGYDYAFGAETQEAISENNTERNRRQTRERTEAGLNRPSVAEQEGRQAGLEDAVSALESRMSMRGRGGTRQVQNRVTLQLDRRQLASVIQELDLDRETGEGGTVTDEFGNAQSVWE